MSIEQRLRDCKLLYDQGHYEGALLSALVATAGTARIRYPHPQFGDKVSFTRFMTEIMPNSCHIAIGGAQLTYHEFLYKVLRNKLVHEGKLPEPISFRPAECSRSARILYGCDGLPGIVIIEHTLVLVIAHTVSQAPENSPMPPDVAGLFAPV